MLKIYHFANLGFGLPFLEQYAEFGKDLLSNLDVTVIFSTKQFYRQDASRFSRMKSGLKSALWKFSVKKRFKGKTFKIVCSKNVNDPAFIKWIEHGSVGICTGFNQIFSTELLTRFENCINVHPSVLPYYRGPDPSYWCLKKKENKTGFTFHQMTEKVDDGKIIFQEIVEIGTVNTANQLDQKIAVQAKLVLQKYIESLANGTFWQSKIIDANTVYSQKTGYLSFPENA